METATEARLRRYNVFWWGAFVLNIVVGASNAATGGFWIWVAWANAVAAICMIVSRKRFHRRMRALGLDAKGRAIHNSGHPK